MPINRTLFRVEVAETDHTRAYWASRPWVSGERRDVIGSADVIIVPWENFRQDEPALFPEGATDFIRTLQSELSSVAVAIDPENYKEIALYASEWRLPSLACTVVIFPILTGVLGNHVDRWITGLSSDTVVEMEMIVEGERGKCFSVKYKGPPAKLVDTLAEQVKNCFDEKSEPQKKLDPQTKPERQKETRKPRR